MSTKNKSKLERKLSHEDVFCIACRCIYIQPVTMPCKHSLCLECFKNMVNITAYQCPLCRRRISNWLRKYKQNWNSMINVSLWEAVQQQYPVEVQKKLNGEDDGLEEIIVSHQGVTHLIDSIGEMAEEYDLFMSKYDQEQRKIEQLNLTLATKLQEEEEAKEQSQIMLNSELLENDERLAVTIQEELMEELARQNHLNYESDLLIAQQLQDQVLPKMSTKKISPKKGPLDKMFIRLGSQVLCNTKENNSLSFNSQSSSASTSFPTPDTSSSGYSSDLSVSSSTIGSSKILDKENVETCTCGRLQDDFNSSIPPCNFCTAQITLLDSLLTNQKNDFIMAKELDKKLNSGNFEDYNLRKRTCSTPSSGRKKIRKLSKGQLTIQELLQKNGTIKYD